MMLCFSIFGSLRSRTAYSITNISTISGKDRKLANTDHASMLAQQNRTLETRLIVRKNTVHAHVIWRV